MTPGLAVLALLVGLVAGVLSGLFGVGGGIVMTPGMQVLLGAPPIVALATPLPVILPTALAGALRYRRAGQVDVRAATWMAAAGVATSALGAEVANRVPVHSLLIVTAILLAWQAVAVIRGGAREPGGSRREPGVGAYAAIGSVAGFVSGLLAIGGGIVMVPMMAGWLRMPLKRALGTSLAAIVVLVIPGTIVHALHGNIDPGLFLVVTAGAVPGARIGAAIALGTRERTLRLLVGGFLLLVALVYGASEVAALLKA